MVLQGQRVRSDRYAIIPRTLTFLLNRDHVLLIKLGQDRGAWAGKYNGLGGHIEAGEDPLSSARREIFEETGLEPVSLQLAGVLHVDTGSSPGVGLYVFTGEAPGTSLQYGSEGQPEWIPLSELEARPLVSDLLDLIPAAIQCRERKATFSALTTFDEDGTPILKIAYE